MRTAELLNTAPASGCNLAEACVCCLTVIVQESVLSVTAAVCLGVADVLERPQNPAGMRHDPVGVIWFFTSCRQCLCILTGLSPLNAQ